MPPSLDPNNSQPSNGTSQNNKLTQKSATAGVHIPTKNGRKNGTAKDGGGGVLAAVTKNAAKISTMVPTPPSSAQSPEVHPGTPPSTGLTPASPLFDALSPAVNASSVSQATTEWTKNVPALSSSPNDLVNLGESPPILPSSYEDPSANTGWTHRDQRGFLNGQPLSASPPIRHRRPLSYQLDSTYHRSSDDHLSMPPYGVRRGSFYSQYAQNLRYGPQPPLPHQAQAHFYGVPDANLMLPPTNPGPTPGENGLYCGFDTLPTSFQNSSKPVDNVVVVGYDGGFTISSVTRGGLNKIIDISGLRGGVYNAKILPWSTGGSNAVPFPLIAVVVHGRVRISSNEGVDESAITSSPSSSNSRSDPLRGSPKIPGPLAHENEANLAEEYQTTVEIYSLGSKEHVTTLLSVPKTQNSVQSSRPLFTPPPPTGSLSLRADSGNVIITAGTTGETWIFRHENLKAASGARFRCIGKIWTTVQHGLSVDATASKAHNDADWHSIDDTSKQIQYKASILSLNGRWLAYCPAAASSQISLRAVVPAAASISRVPGLNMHAPPQVPPVNCAVDTPGGESIVKQLAQLATQEFIKGAAFVGKQGVQAWNHWWNSPPTSQIASGGVAYQAHTPVPQQFPPTHSLTTQTPTPVKDPGLISILDLDSLGHQGSSPVSSHPLITFKVPHGCSFLSFAPSGLMLFTASSKGDVQFVWDLKRMQYSRSSLLKGGLQSPGVQGSHVRQIAQFSRMTIARVVDVVWTSPHGERAAMVTEPGTVHVLDLPASAFTWPAPRRKVPVSRSDDSGGDSAGTGLSAASVASTAVNSIWTAARPLVSRPRRSSAGISGLSASTVTSHAGHSTHVLAAGISRSVGAATGRMNEMRRASGNRVYVPRGSTIPSPGCVKLFSSKRGDSIYVVGGGVVRIYSVKSRRADRPTDKQKASRGAKFVEYTIPSLPNFNEDAQSSPDRGHHDDAPVENSHGHPLRLSRQVQHPVRGSGNESSIPQAEIESNAPYQPFHTDRRVGLYVNSNRETPAPSPSVSALLSPPGAADAVVPLSSNKSSSRWAFGGPINAVRLNVGLPQPSEDGYGVGSEHRALPSSAIERVLRIAENNEDMEQIVVTTRKRRGAGRSSLENGGDDEEGFFEDDCEVLDFASQRV